MRISVLSFLLFFLVLHGTSLAQYKQYENGLESYKAQKYDEAIAYFNDYFTKLIKDKKIDVEVYYYRGLSQYKKSDYAMAIPDFEKAIEFNHSNTGNIHWFLAKSHDRLGQSQKALDEYGKAIKILGSDKATHAKLLFERGQLYSRSNNPTAAFDDLSAATKLNPNDESIKDELNNLNRQTRSGKQEDVASNSKKEQNKQETQPRTDPPKKESVDKQNKNNPAAQNPVVISSVPATESVKELKPEATAVDAKSALAEMYANEKRYALVIGNSAYPKEIGALRNPVNDAMDLAKELQSSKFEVQLLTNVTYIQMREAMRKFNEKLANGPKDQTVGLFYFAGHGVQFESENYMIPIDAKVEFEDDISRMCFPVQRMVLANMERSNSRMNIVILDACRNNPFPAATRSVSQGLGEMKRGRGSFIAYATAPGSVASDGSGRNGLYTQELLKALRKPGLTIEQVFKEVRLNVLRMSGDKQLTWDSSNIIGEFYFKF